MITTLTDAAITHGTRGVPHRILLADDQWIIVAAGPETTCTPTPAPERLYRWNRDSFFDVPADYPGPYTTLCVGIDFGPDFLDGPRHAPADWPAPEPSATADIRWELREAHYEDDDVRWYPHVPAEILRAYVLGHGGEHPHQPDAYDDAYAMCS
ncbi:hypothetical protein ABR737_01640 [Streptomyces sp. Edi2]|uniref:hypothetical protein n=1 Tax=Streptomyces sp. Edi2 TaxID=3162528 RepID=UPI0033060B88